MVASDADVLATWGARHLQVARALEGADQGADLAREEWRALTSQPSVDPFPRLPWVTRGAYQTEIDFENEGVFKERTAPGVLLLRDCCRSLEQRPNARVQRGWNAQPFGIAVRRGIAPSICVSRSLSATMLGIEPIRPAVYGCCGRS